jgi:hypothetical protein
VVKKEINRLLPDVRCRQGDAAAVQHAATAGQIRHPGPTATTPT